MTETKAKSKPVKTAVKKPVVHKAVAKPIVHKAVAAGKYIEAMGKRKTAAARVRLFDGGKGVITVNDMPLVEYFKTPLAQMVIREPLKGTSLEEQFDFTVHVRGGGKQGQAEAVRHGIARTLLIFNEELRSVLKSQRWLTRDARKKERKKPGLKRARRAPQWSKR